MSFARVFLGLALLASFAAQAKVNYDRKDKIKGVSLQTGKVDDIRTYRGFTSKTFPHSIEVLKNSITNFSEKCNNEFRKKREFTDQDYDCKYHNENFVESFVVENPNTKTWTKEHGEVERYILGRRTYNRGLSGFYEMVQVFKGKNKEGQNTLVVTQKMLSNDEVKKFTTPKIEQDSAFTGHEIKYILTEISPTHTELKYIYRATTDHWVLNKELSVPQVFASISKSVNDLVSTVAVEASGQTREIASEE